MITPDPIDYLPYVDGAVSEAETAAIEQLISQDLSRANLAALHPDVDRLVPLSSRPPLQAFGLEDPEEPPVLSAVSMDRYTDWADGVESDPPADAADQCYDRMYTALSYSVLRDRNARLQAQGGGGERHRQAAADEHLAAMCAVQSAELHRKRSRADELHERRGAKQGQFAPVQGYLDSRWKDGVRNMVDMGIGRTMT